MSVKKIKFDHDFLESSITGMIWYIKELMKPFKNTLNNKVFPVSIMNTGDEKFLFDMIDEKAIYSHSPRWTFNILGVNTKNSDRTNPRENGSFVAKTTNSLGQSKTENFTAKLSRRPIEVGFQSEVVFNNIFEYFRFVEIYLILSTNPHIFKFYHSNKLHYGQFTFPELDDTSANVTFGMESEKRNRKLPVNFTLNLQFPAYNIYGLPGSANEGFNGPNDDGSAGGTEDLTGDTMIKIIHNIYPKFNKESEESIKITQIITPPNT